MASIRTIMYLCDNPQCLSRQEHSKDEPALGYHISGGAWHLGGGGGPIPATYACSVPCITPAIEARIKETWG